MIPLAVRFEALICSCLNAGIVDLYPAEDMDLRLLCLLFVA